MATYSKPLFVDFGKTYTGLATVGYKLFNSDGTMLADWSTSGVAELVAGTGIYFVLATITDTWEGFVSWRTSSSGESYASENIPLRGVELVAAGLDKVTATEPTGKPTTFTGWVMWLIQRFRRASKTPTSLLVKTEAGATVTTQPLTDDGDGTETLGAPS